MSVLIKGMEMPPDCEKCPFFDYEEGFCFASGIKGKSGWYEYVLRLGGIKDGRHDDCPLVEIPPHGRLIDADAPIPLVDTHGKKIEVTVAHIIENNLGIVNAIIEAEDD
jgi:hypothetical protein